VNSFKDLDREDREKGNAGGDIRNGWHSQSSSHSGSSHSGSSASKATMEQIGRQADQAHCEAIANRNSAEKELAILKGQLASFSAASKYYADPRNLKPHC